MNNFNTLLNDKALAAYLNISKSWVRKERWLRKQGKPHTLTLDPIMIGTAPRYRLKDIDDWLASLEGKNQKSLSNNHNGRAN